MNKRFAILDCNNFYASSERVFNPKLEGRPIVVLSNNDGCAIARSQEAKDIGLKMGMPHFEFKPLVKKHGIQVFSSNYALYGDMSDRVMTVLQEFIPDLEIYSIDEAFFDLSHLPENEVETFATNLRNIIKKWTGIPVSIGVGSTKTLAKVANHWAKKEKSLNGVFFLKDRNLIDLCLKQTEVDHIWGVGLQYAKKLNRYGIRTAFDLQGQNSKWLRENFTIQGARIAEELKGHPCYDLDLQPDPKKNIGVSRSFREPLKRLEDLEPAISSFVERACEKLRKDKLRATGIMVYMRTNPFQKEKFYSHSYTLTFSDSDQTPELIGYALKALKKIYKPHQDYKKAGILLLELTPHNQQDFFKPTDGKMEKMMKTLDGINRRYGPRTLMYASSLKSSALKSCRTMISQRYTTCWHELLTVR